MNYTYELQNLWITELQICHENTEFVSAEVLHHIRNLKQICEEEFVKH